MIEQHELRLGAFSVYAIADGQESAQMNLDGLIEAVLTGQPCYVTGDTLEGFGDIGLDELVN